MSNMENPLIKAIDHFGSITALAAAINENQSTVSMWKSRDNVPSDYWKKIEDATEGEVSRLDFLDYLDFKAEEAASA